MYGVAAFGAGIRSPVIGASGEADGFHLIARRTSTVCWGGPYGGQAGSYGVGVVMAAGKDPTAGGAAMDGSLRDNM